MKSESAEHKCTTAGDKRAIAYRSYRERSKVGDLTSTLGTRPADAASHCTTLGTSPASADFLCAALLCKRTNETGTTAKPAARNETASQASGSDLSSLLSFLSSSTE